MKPFDYLRPLDLTEALSAWRERGDQACLLAGGTDLTVGLRQGRVKTDLVIDLKAVAELKSEITRGSGMLRVSAGTTMSTLSKYLERNDLFPALQEAATVVGSIQIRNRATLVGNICNASPAADTVPVLAVLGAEVEISGLDGVRTKAVTAFIEGNRQIDLGAGEIVTSVVIPIPERSGTSVFDRITRRRGVDLATVNMCCALDSEGVVFAFGAVSPRPLVVRDTSGVLGDPASSVAERAEVIRQMSSHATPISDVRAEADYRQAMLNVMAERSLEIAHARLRGHGTNA